MCVHRSNFTRQNGPSTTLHLISRQLHITGCVYPSVIMSMHVNVWLNPWWDGNKKRIIVQVNYQSYYFYFCLRGLVPSDGLLHDDRLRTIQFFFCEIYLDMLEFISVYNWHDHSLCRHCLIHTFFNLSQKQQGTANDKWKIVFTCFV